MQGVTSRKNLKNGKRRGKEETEHVATVRNEIRSKLNWLGMNLKRKWSDGCEHDGGNIERWTWMERNLKEMNLLLKNALH